MYYVLIEGETVPVTDVKQWAVWMDLARKNDLMRVDRTEVGEGCVSTVFLGLDHSFFDGPPLLFETMVFDSEFHGDEQWRYTTLAQAQAGHDVVVADLRARMGVAEREAQAILTQAQAPVKDKP